MLVKSAPDINQKETSIDHQLKFESIHECLFAEDAYKKCYLPWMVVFVHTAVCWQSCWRYSRISSHYNMLDFLQNTHNRHPIPSPHWWNLGCLVHLKSDPSIYQVCHCFVVSCQTSNISCTLVCSKIVDHSDVVGASPVGAAPTTSSFSIKHMASMDWAKTTTRRDGKHLS